MTYMELYEKANRMLDSNEITLGEYEEMIKPLDAEVNTGQIKALPPTQPTQKNYSNTLDALDCVSRQSAIEAVLHHGEIENHYTDLYYDGYCDGVYDSADILKDMPSAQSERWIPCSERVPEEDGLYLVTSREKATAEEFGFDLDDVEVRKMRFNEDGWRIPKHIPEWINGVVHTTVIAWMPLPEPYEERREEE